MDVMRTSAGQGRLAFSINIAWALPCGEMRGRGLGRPTLRKKGTGTLMMVIFLRALFHDRYIHYVPTLSNTTVYAFTYPTINAYMTL